MQERVVLSVSNGGQVRRLMYLTLLEVVDDESGAGCSSHLVVVGVC